MNNIITQKQTKELELNDKVVTDIDIEQLILLKDYTAFEVFPTKEAIPAGTVSNVKYTRYIWNSDDTFVKGSAVYHEASDTVYRCLENCKGVEPTITDGWESKWISHDGFGGQYYKYMTDVPANDTIDIRFYSYSKTREDCDIIIDWGDGNISKVANLSDTSITSFTNYEDRYGSGYLYSNLRVKHTYSNEHCETKLIIKIYGKDYFMIRCGNHDKNPIISRIFDRDLPIASNVTNVSSLVAYSKKLLQVILPYNYNFGNIINFSVIFNYCDNLQFVDMNSITKFNLGSIDTLKVIFQGCKNMFNASLNMTQFINESTIQYIMDGCVMLEEDILNILPKNGFNSTRELNVERSFQNCKKLYCSDYDKLSNILWNNPNINFINTSFCFNGCSDEFRSHIPVSWGGTKV